MEPVRSRKITALHQNYNQAEIKKQQDLKKKRLGLYRRLVFIGLLALGIGYTIGSVLLSQSEILNEKMNEKIKLEKELSSLKEQEKDYRAEIVKLNDEEYVAKVARSEYFLSEEGEIIFKLP